MNICVIGLGSMGRRRIRLLKKINSDFIIVGIDNNLERAKAVGEECGMACYSSIEVVNELLDCAFICTTPQSHGELIKRCLQMGCHVFSEINLINDLYKENIQLAKEKKKVLFLSSTPFYKAEMQFINKRLRQNEKPCVYQYHVGQYLPDWHPWDNLKEFFVSRRVTNGCRELLAIELPWMQETFGKITRVNVIKRKLTALDLEFPDTYLVQLEHESGSAGSLIVDIVSRQAVRQLEVLNEEIYIRWNGTPDSLFEKNIESGELIQIQPGEYIHEQGYGDFINEYAYIKEIEEFFGVINGGQASYSFEKDYEILEIIDKIES